MLERFGQVIRVKRIRRSDVMFSLGFFSEELPSVTFPLS